MIIGVALVAVAVLIVAIWGFLGLKRMRHKILAIFLIALTLFAYFSITLAFKEKNVDLESVEGITKATKFYFSWLGYAFTNLKTITAKAIKMNWKGNSTT